MLYRLLAIERQLEAVDASIPPSMQVTVRDDQLHFHVEDPMTRIVLMVSSSGNNFASIRLTRRSNCNSRGCPSISGCSGSWSLASLSSLVKTHKDTYEVGHSSTYFGVGQLMTVCRIRYRDQALPRAFPVVAECSRASHLDGSAGARLQQLPLRGVAYWCEFWRSPWCCQLNPSGAGDLNEPLLNPDHFLSDLHFVVDFLAKVPESFIHTGSDLLAKLVAKVEARFSSAPNGHKRPRQLRDSFRRSEDQDEQALPHKVRALLRIFCLDPS